MHRPGKNCTQCTLHVFQRSPQFFLTPTFSPQYLRFPSVEMHPHFSSGCMCVRALSTITGFLGKSQAMLTWAVGVCIQSYWAEWITIFKDQYRTRLKDICRAIITEGQYRTTLEWIYATFENPEGGGTPKTTYFYRITYQERGTVKLAQTSLMKEKSGLRSIHTLLKRHWSGITLPSWSVAVLRLQSC